MQTHTDIQSYVYRALDSNSARLQFRLFTILLANYDRGGEHNYELERTTIGVARTGRTRADYDRGRTN
eukprot:4083723-Karenia_brevis.AAC.1